MNKLPSKRDSQQIQRRHLRRYASGKITLVNPEVKKKNNQNLSRQTPATSRPVSPRRYGEASPNNKLSDSQKLRERFRTPKIRWQQEFNIQTGPTKMDLEAKQDKELEEVRKTLQPGEVLARAIKLGYPSNPMSVSGFIDYVDDNGQLNRYFMEYRMSGASLIEYLQEMQELEKPVILYFGDDDGIKWLQGARPAEPITLQDTIPQRELFYSIKPAPTKKYPNRIAVSKGMFELDIESVRYFKNREELEKEENKLAKIGLNIFMEPTSPQTTLKNFEKKK
jgi:hypothetical protein